MASRVHTPGSRDPRNRPGHTTRPLVLTALLCAFASSIARGAPLYLSPTLDAAAGTTSNRFLASEAEASPFLRFAPALEAVWFGSADWEAGAVVRHRTTRYARSGFERQDETSARIYLWLPMPAADLFGSVEGGVYRDRAIPVDDATWSRATATVFGLPARRLSPGLTGRLTRTRFDSRTTGDGAARSDLRWALEPTLKWQLGSEQTLWAAAILEGANSNVDTGVYRGFGLTAGLDARLRDALDAGIWARWQRRSYDDTDLPDTPQRTDTPVGVGAWGTLRLSAWAELTADAHYLDHSSDSPFDDYREWGVEAGVRLRYDWRVER